MDAKKADSETRGSGQGGRSLMLAIRCAIVGAVLVALACQVPALAQGIAALPLGSNKIIRIGFDTFSDTEAINAPAKVILERLGYTVDIQSYEVAILYAGIAEGRLNVYSGGYLPGSHKDYWDKYGGRVLKLGPLHNEQKFGLAVPAYVTDVKSISDLVGREAEFGGKVLGNTPGSGNMRMAANAIKTYNLKMQLIESSDVAQSAAMAKGISNNEKIVFIAWSPQWWWGKWKLKWLEDPRGVFPPNDGVYHIVDKNLEKNSPRAYAFYKNYTMTADQESYIMLLTQEGMKSEDAARKFIADNPSLVKKWLGE